MPATVLLTRPAGRNTALAALLREAGLVVREAPALAVRNLPTPRPAPEAGNLYLFVSRQAVEAYFTDARQDRWPPGAWACAVGGATARALKARLPAGQVLAPEGRQAADSEALLALIDARRLPPAQAHILRAQHGRDWMAEQLRARGWSVCCHALYERRPLVLDAAACKVLASGSQCVLLVTSLEALDAIDASLRRHELAWPEDLRVVTLHPRMARRLQCWYADRPAGALHVSVSAPDDLALFHAILSASRLPH